MTTNGVNPPPASRGCQWQARLRGHFVAVCCFPGIYFISNISFVPPNETGFAIAVETGRSVHATKLDVDETAGRRGLKGHLRAPFSGAGRVELGMLKRIAAVLAATMGLGLMF